MYGFDWNGSGDHDAFDSFMDMEVMSDSDSWDSDLDLEEDSGDGFGGDIDADFVSVRPSFVSGRPSGLRPKKKNRPLPISFHRRLVKDLRALIAIRKAEEEAAPAEAREIFSAIKDMLRIKAENGYYFSEKGKNAVSCFMPIPSQYMIWNRPSHQNGEAQKRDDLIRYEISPALERKYACFLQELTALAEAENIQVEAVVYSKRTEDHAPFPSAVPAEGQDIMELCIRAEGEVPPEISRAVPAKKKKAAAAKHGTDPEEKHFFWDILCPILMIVIILGVIIAILAAFDLLRGAINLVLVGIMWVYLKRYFRN